MDLVNYCICEYVRSDCEVAFSASLDCMRRRYNVRYFIAPPFAREFWECSKYPAISRWNRSDYYHDIPYVGDKRLTLPKGMRDYTTVGDR